MTSNPKILLKHSRSSCFTKIVSVFINDYAMNLFISTLFSLHNEQQIYVLIIGLPQKQKSKIGR